MICGKWYRVRGGGVVFFFLNAAHTFSDPSIFVGKKVLMGESWFLTLCTKLASEYWFLFAINGTAVFWQAETLHYSFQSDTVGKWRRLHSWNCHLRCGVAQNPATIASVELWSEHIGIFSLTCSNKQASIYFPGCWWVFPLSTSPSSDGLRSWGWWWWFQALIHLMFALNWYYGSPCNGWGLLVWVALSCAVITRFLLS
jgi:hypothetical protein